MKILFIVDDFSGGAGNVIQILANEFYRRRNDVIVLLLNYHTHSNLLNDEISIITHNVSSENASNKLLWMKKTTNELRKLIMELDPNVVISFLDNNNTLTGLSLMFEKIPLIVSERSNPIAIKPKGVWKILRIPAYLRANVVTVQCSNFVKFSKLFSHKTYVTPNPIARPTIERITLRDDDKKIHIISCGRLAQVKRFDLMICTFYKVNKRFPNSVLHIYGEGSERRNLEQLIAELSLNGKVELPGQTNDIYTVLNNGDIYLMTSDQEGFPNALSEAMATGLPCVAFECHEGLRDLVDDGINGFLVPPGNIELMAERVCSLVENDNLRNTFAEKAQLVSKKFSVNSVCDIWEGLIKSVSEVR